jgi:hypothetical protein
MSFLAAFSGCAVGAGIGTVAAKLLLYRLERRRTWREMHAELAAKGNPYA